MYFVTYPLKLNCLYLVNVSLNVKLSLIAIVAKPDGCLNNCHVSY